MQKYELDDATDRGRLPVSGLPHVTARAYIRHLLKAKEMLGMRLCVLHNLYFYNHLMEEIRNALDEGRFAAYKKEMLESMAAGEQQ